MNRFRLARLSVARLVAASVALGATAGSVLAATTEVEFQAQIAVSNAIERGSEFQKNELSFEPRIDIWFAGGARLTAKGLLRSDFADKLEPGRPSNDTRSSYSGRIALGEHTELEVRELFLDFELGDTQMRVGKQQVVWGQADGLRILDVVNPLSFREFILPDFEDRRIPLWMVNAQVPVGEAALQLLWIPDQTYDEFADASGAFAFTSPEFRPALDQVVRIRSARKPNNFLKDSDVGARLSAFVGGWDLTASYLYHYQDQPVLVLDRSPGMTQITPTYERTHLSGVTASKAFGDFVFRGELGYSTDRYFASSERVQGIEKSHEVSGVLGLDYSGITDLLISGQFFQSSVEGDGGIQRARHERSVSLLVRRNFSNDTVTLEMLAIHNTNDSDGLVQIELSYQLTSNITLSAGADVFYGDADGLFGQFDARDRFSLKVEIGV